eukprot:5165905-Pyramimonas_sp.AAC.1
MRRRCTRDGRDASAPSAWTEWGSTSRRIADASAMQRDPPTPSQLRPHLGGLEHRMEGRSRSRLGREKGTNAAVPRRNGWIRLVVKKKHYGMCLASFGMAWG